MERGLYPPFFDVLICRFRPEFESIYSVHLSRLYCTVPTLFPCIYVRISLQCRSIRCTGQRTTCANNRRVHASGRKQALSRSTFLMRPYSTLLGRVTALPCTLDLRFVFHPLLRFTETLPRFIRCLKVWHDESSGVNPMPPAL